jgi:hypothetical protein
LEIFVDDETKLTLHGLQQFFIKLGPEEKNRCGREGGREGGKGVRREGRQKRGMRHLYGVGGGWR